MRVLLAYDVSPGAEVAASLALATQWPPGTAVRVVAVLEPPKVADGLPRSPTPLIWLEDVESQIGKYLEDEVAALVKRLRDAGIDAEGVVLRGRPATVLVDEARAHAADVVIAGSRGHGRIASLFLGSVSAELVDRAPCPVLVARQPTAKQILFATDGSAHADRAERVLTEWPIFRGATLRALSVAEVIAPWHTGIAPGMYRVAVDTYSKDLDILSEEHGAIARATADRLAAAGYEVDSKLRVGDAAAEVIEEAATWPADLIVMGSQGLTGLSRLVLGSVARNVLAGTQSSVLIVRDREATD